MSVLKWIGKAPRVNKVATVVVGSATNGETFTVSLANPSGRGAAVQFATRTASGDTTSTIASSLQSQLAASNHPFARACTFTVNTATVTITANVGGVPFIASVGGTGTLTLTTTTANSGPNDFSVPGNFDTGVIPASGDYLTISGLSDILYGLNAGVYDLTELHVLNYNGTIGDWYQDLQLAGVTMTFNCPGSGKLYFNLSTSTGTSLLWLKNAPGVLSGEYGVNINQASSSANITRTQVDGGSLKLWTSTTTLDHRGGSTTSIDAVATLRQVGGDVLLQGTGTTTTTAAVYGGTLTTESNLIVTTADINGGRFISNATGTVGTLNCDGGVSDFSQSQNSRTVTNTNLRGGQFIRDVNIVTLTNAPAETIVYAVVPVFGGA